MLSSLLCSFIQSQSEKNDEQDERTIEFLDNVALATRIVQVTSGKQVRCAVAFWSAAGVEKVFPNGVQADTKIVCDISMGSTSAEALTALKAPNNPNLRHLVRMHAKVFISDEGLVVGSANASASGLGHVNTEVGTFHPPCSAPWKNASEWFEKIFNKSTEINNEEIQWTKLSYRPKLPLIYSETTRQGSLFDLVTAAPWRFSNVGFAFPLHQSPDELNSKVREAVIKSKKYDLARTSELDDGGTFTGWGKDTVGLWPEYFFSFWQPFNKLYVSGRRVEAKVPSLGAVMTSRDWRGLRASCDLSSCDFRLPTALEISIADFAKVQALKKNYGGLFCANGDELAAAIAKVKVLAH